MRDRDERLLTVVNEKHPVPENWNNQLVEIEPDVWVDEEIRMPLLLMLQACEKNGIKPKVNDGWRSREEQERIMKERIEDFIHQGYEEKVAIEYARRTVAVSGCSEHQLGLCVDIIAETATLEDCLEVYDWLAQHAWRYGFILRYAKGKERITGIEEEPWHYRYVGIETAKELEMSQLCLEEYVISSESERKQYDCR